MRRHLDSLQIFRGFAAIQVVLFHVAKLIEDKSGAPFLGGVFDRGYAGVDFFFVLSGYIITYAHRGDFNSQRWGRFALRRALRVFPAYWVVSAGLLLGHLIVPGLGSHDEQGAAFVAKSLFLLPQERYPLLAVGWSLTHEVFFYIVFCTAFIVRIGNFARYAIVGAFTLMPFFFGFQHPGSEQSFFLGFFFSKYNLEFAFGVCAALASPMLDRKASNSLLVIGVAFYIGAIFGFDLEAHGVDRVWAFGLPCCLLVAGAGNTDFRLNNRFGLALGDASYSIYLVHNPLLVAGMAFTGKALFSFAPSGVIGIVLAVVSVAAGLVFHFVVEAPLNRLGKFLTRERGTSAPHVAV